MKRFAHHYVDTPHGDSHAPISISVLLTVLFIGAQFVIWVPTSITTVMGEPTIYSGSNPFTVASTVVAVLLMAFLVVDFRRNRLEAHGRQRFQERQPVSIEPSRSSGRGARTASRSVFTRQSGDQVKELLQPLHCSFAA